MKMKTKLSENIGSLLSSDKHNLKLGDNLWTDFENAWKCIVIHIVCHLLGLGYQLAMVCKILKKL